MIYYNAMLLSHLWERKAHNGDLQGAALLVQVSPVAWQHINVYGRYEFSRGPTAINMTEIIEELDRVPMTPELV
jgi:Tn3 transposase DDE domain